MAMALISIGTNAQKPKLTLEELNFGGSRYWDFQPEYRYLGWWGDVLIESDVDEIKTVNQKDGATSTLFKIDDVKVSDAKGQQLSVRSLHSAKFPYADKTWVLLSNLTENVDKGRQTCLVDWKEHKLVAAYSHADAVVTDFSAEAMAMACVIDGNLYVKLSDGTSRQLTTDGSRQIVYGQPVHRDEFGITKGTFWSPDGKKLAFYRMDQSMVTDYPLVDIDTRIATEAPEKYPMAGETSHQVTIGVYDLQSQQTIYLDAGDPTDRYFTNIQWSPDGTTIYLKELNRDQTDMSLDAYNATTGKKLRTLYTEHNDKYVHPVTPIQFLPWDSDKFILQSERDGYNHIYLFSVAKGELRQLTSGKWTVSAVEGFCPKNKSIIITSTEAHDLQHNIYAVDVKSGKRTLLDNGRGSHSPQLSVSGQMLVDVYSEPTVPRNIDLVSTTKKSSLRLLTAKNPREGYEQPIVESGSILAADDSTTLYYRMVKPENFDPSKKYPTIVYVYGGPCTRNVEAAWNYWMRSWEWYMASKGYIIFILDNRGSSDRGLAFEQATFRHLGIEEMKDQMRGVDFLKSLPYVDSDRLGVHGWSFGGYMTISLMTTYPDVFKVGVAGGPVIDWKYYEVMYGERYMDTPQTNPEGYAETTLLSKAKNLKGKLQIIIGMNDPVVVPQHALSFLKECISAGTQPDFFVYPGEPHNMRGHQSVHLHERITQYFEDYLK